MRGCVIRMPRIFHLVKGLGRGGAEVLLAEGLRFADRDHFDYGYGYFLPHKAALVPSLAGQGADVVCFDCRNNLSILWAAKRVANHLQEWGAQLLHCHLPMAGVAGRVAGRMSGIPVVYTEHNRMERYHPITRRLNVVTWRWQDRVIAVSAEVAKSIQVHADSVVRTDVVLNGVDTDRFDRARVDGPAMRRRLGIPIEVPVIGTVAVFRAQKALEDWLRAARILLDSRPDLHFLLVGDGPLRDEIVAQARGLDLEDVVHFPGLQEDVRPYLAAMDLFMVSSVFEGLPVALLEAMAMRCRVVATAVGGVPEVIRDGENGFLVAPRQPGALARCASQLLTDSETVRAFGEQGRRTVEDRFSLRRMMHDLEATYVDVLEQRRSAVDGG
ncbi:MAG: glycosyltransferase [Gemmatimonadota bacterium]